MILMQRNNNFSLLTAKVGFSNKEADIYSYKKRGSFFYNTVHAYSLSVAKSYVICGYTPIREQGPGLITKVFADKSFHAYPYYSKNIKTTVYDKAIQFQYQNFKPEFEGVVQCLMKPSNHLSARFHLILMGECIYLFICPFKCALAGTMCL